MQFNDLAAFINMGGYGFYVWLSFGLSALLLSLLIGFSLKRTLNIKHQIRQRLKRENKLKEAAELHQKM